MQQLNKGLSNQNNESKTNLSHLYGEFDEERAKLENRLMDSERTLVMVASQSDALAREKSDLMKHNAALEKKLKETPPLAPPTSTAHSHTWVPHNHTNPRGWCVPICTDT